MFRLSHLYEWHECRTYKPSSDADAEVLADYVIALVVADDPEATIKRNCIDSLSDFLQDST